MNITFLADYTTQYACKVGKRMSSVCIIRWFKFTLKPPYSIAHDKL